MKKSFLLGIGTAAAIFTLSASASLLAGPVGGNATLYTVITKTPGNKTIDATSIQILGSVNVNCSNLQSYNFPPPRLITAGTTNETASYVNAIATHFLGMKVNQLRCLQMKTAYNGKQVNTPMIKLYVDASGQYTGSDQKSPIVLDYTQ